MTTAIVMPAWNEAGVVGEFVQELDIALTAFDPVFFVVDDHSTDGTADELRSRSALRDRLTVVTNAANLGHGPSTLRALRLGLDSHADVIVAIDGDAQFSGSDVARVVSALSSRQCDIVEGVRTERDSPLYRRFVSYSTRLLVWSRVGVRPKDANTPLRAYRPDALRQLLATVPEDSGIPNLFISAASRRLRMSIEQVPVSWIPRAEGSESRATWGARHPRLPSRRFMAFCGSTALQWATTPLRTQHAHVTEPT